MAAPLFDFGECERRLQQVINSPPSQQQLPNQIPHPTGDRHITLDQREEISEHLKDSTLGPISMTATASDREAVGYEREIASVLEDTGFKVDIVNIKGRSAAEEIPAGVEMTVADQTIRLRHAYRILHAFRRAGIALVTRINAKRRRKDTLYITVGPNDAPDSVAATAEGRWQSPAILLTKWKTKVRAWFG
jgi:hypothetical protein